MLCRCNPHRSEGGVASLTTIRSTFRSTYSNGAESGGPPAPAMLSCPPQGSGHQRPLEADFGSGDQPVAHRSAGDLDVLARCLRPSFGGTTSRAANQPSGSSFGRRNPNSLRDASVTKRRPVLVRDGDARLRAKAAAVECQPLSEVCEKAQVANLLDKSMLKKEGCGTSHCFGADHQKGERVCLQAPKKCQVLPIEVHWKAHCQPSRLRL